MDDKQPTVPWEEERCVHVDGGRRCTGVVVGRDRCCLAHTTQDEREKALAALAKGAALSATRGVPISDELLQEILQAARNDEGRVVLRHADFSRATFDYVVAFEKVRFLGGAFFESACFAHAAFFNNCSFEGEAYFSKVHFSSNAFFVGVTFGDRTNFERSHFDYDAAFDRSVFEGTVSLYGAQFAEVSFRGVTFRSPTSLGPLLATKGVDLGGANFNKQATIEIAAKQLSCLAAEFRASAIVRARHALIVLDFAAFQHPATISFAEFPFDRAVLDLDKGALFPERLIDALGEERPTLISLRQVDASQLTLSELDLASCFFHGAFNLDRVKIEGSRPFGKTPHGFRVGWAWPPIWRWTSRYVLAEECMLRASPASEPDTATQARAHPKSAGWDKFPPAVTNLSDHLFIMVTDFRSVDPGRIATLYRSLRKAYEDSKNQPGAADFYYGEMEMRRLDLHTAPAERLLLTLYWLVSGYGLRGSRSFVCLLMIVFASAAGFFFWGFDTDKTFLQTLIYSANSTTSLLRTPDTPLTAAGQIIEIVLRLLGPLLFGLLVLSLRGRVKR
jgi:uncharacterized protein YjbI with pentapeptide repeats